VIGGLLTVSIVATVSPKSLFSLGRNGCPATAGRSVIASSLLLRSCQIASAFLIVS
jgi:hypothetical protein